MGFEDERKLSDNDFLANILGGIRDHRAVSVVLKGVEDENWAVRARAVKILGLLQSVEALTPIRNAVTHDMAEDVRRAAAEAPVRTVGKEALPELLLALQDNDSWGTTDAARLLGELGDSRAVPILTQALSDGAEEVRKEARVSLDTLTARQ